MSGGGSPPVRTRSLRHPLLSIPAPWAPYSAGTKREHNTEGAGCPALAALAALSLARVGLAAKHGQTRSRLAGQLQLRIAPDRECPPVVHPDCDVASSRPSNAARARTVHRPASPAIAATSISIICTAMTIDAANANPTGVALHG